MKWMLVCAALFSSLSHAQDLERSGDKYLGEKYLRYHDREAGVIIQKVTDADCLVSFEIGLMIFSRGRSADDFMRKSSAIVFDDSTMIVFLDPVYVNYFQEGKHQYSVRHVLSHDELLALSTKTVDYFVVGDRKRSMDRWQKVNFRSAVVAVSSREGPN